MFVHLQITTLGAELFFFGVDLFQL